MLLSWFKKWLENERLPDIEPQPKPLSAVDDSQPNASFYTSYFSLIAQGARLKLVEAMFSLNLFALFEKNDTVLESTIIEQLQLMPIRAKKWLHLLSSEHFLIEVTTKDYKKAYKLSDGFVNMMRSEQWWATQFFFNTWMVGADENLTDVLRFGKVKISVSWPPKTETEVLWLEGWMTKTAQLPINSLLEQINFNKVRRVLDVGGGDGTMACALAKAYPKINISVYNLSRSAEMARHNIDAQGLGHRVQVIEGDFIKEDAFPVGFDLILFTRVMFDWDEQVNRKLLKMAYQALPQNGLVAICEFYKDESNDKCLSSEYRYIFHDDFTPHVMKSIAEYQTMLKTTGFSLARTLPKKTGFYRVLLGRK